jgi:hypothetical protein
MQELSKEEMLSHIEEALEHIRDAELGDEAFSILIDVYHDVAEILEIIDESEGEEGEGDEEEKEA